MGCTCNKRGSRCPVHSHCQQRVWPGYATAYPSWCKRTPRPNGFCAYHQPEAAAAREAKRDAKANAYVTQLKYNSAVQVARNRVVEEAMKAYEPGVHELARLWRACRKLVALQKKGTL